jgi:hypothetical protein
MMTPEELLETIRRILSGELMKATTTTQINGTRYRVSIYPVPGIADARIDLRRTPTATPAPKQTTRPARRGIPPAKTPKEKRRRNHG